MVTRNLVTGGAGFIGSHLVEALLSRGEEVLVLDDFSTGRSENLPTDHPQLEIMTGSITDPKILSTAMEGVDLVFHLAGLVTVPDSVDNPSKSIELNDLGVYNTYQAALTAGVRRVIFSSSSAVYGDQPGPHHENLCPRPDTPYAMHKLLGEHYGLFFYKHRQLESVYLRYFNVYGPRQLPDSPYSGVISLFVDQLCKGQKSYIYGDGQQTRDFVYVADVVRANLAAAYSAQACGQCFNIGSGRATTIGKLYQLLSLLTGQPGLSPEYQTTRSGDILHSVGPVEAAAKILKIQPLTDLGQGLSQTWEWFLEHQEDIYSKKQTTATNQIITKGSGSIQAFENL